MSGRRIWITVVSAAAVIGVAIALLASSVDRKYKPSLLMTERDRALEAVSQELIDPSSAQFRNVFKHDYAMEFWCGEVNGKNSFGAYAGFRKFYASEDFDGVFDVEIYNPNDFRGFSDDVFEDAVVELFQMNCGEDFLSK